MAEHTTKINIEGDDSDFSSLLDKLRSKAKETYADLQRDAQQYSQNTAEQLRFIENELNRSGKETGQSFQADRLSMAQRYDHLKETASSPEDRKRMTSEYQTYMRGSRNEEQGEKLIAQLLKDLLTEQKTQSAQDKRFQTEDLQEEEAEQREEAVDNPNRERKRNNFFGWLQGDDVEDGYNEAGGGSSGSEKKNNNNAKGKFDKTAEIASKDSFHMVPALIGAAGLAGIAGVLSKAIELGGQLDTASLTSRAVTGNPASELDSLRENINDFGFTRAQAYDIGTKGATARGFRGDFAEETVNTIALAKGYGLDAGNIQALDKNARYDNNRRSGSQQTANIIGMFAGHEGAGRNGDFSRLAELMQMQNSLTAGLAKRMDSVSTASTTAMLTKFTSLGGAFGDDRATEKIQSIDASLANPDNEYAQALNYNILRQQNPNADLWNLKKAQAKGIGAKGLLSGTLDDLAGSSLNENMQKLQLSERFKGLNPDDIENIYAKYKENSNFFDDIDSNKAKQAQYGIDTSRGKENVGELNVASARHADYFSTSGRLLVNAVSKVTGDIIDVTDKMGFVPDKLKNIVSTLDKINANMESKNGLRGNRR